MHASINRRRGSRPAVAKEKGELSGHAFGPGHRTQ
jgi:hypothetical protein